MTDNIQITELVEQLELAERRVASAQLAVAEDKAARSGSLVARLVDAISTTAPEAALSVAERQLECTTKQLRIEARAWIRENARQKLDSNPKDNARHVQLSQEVEGIEIRLARIWGWLNLANDADSKLSTAASMCSSASSMEVFDLCSNNNAISLISAGNTGDANRALQSARAAVKRLARALPNHTDELDVELPNDTLDLVVDLAISPVLDVLSWFNIGTLNNARDDCLRAQQAIRPLLKQLRRLERNLCSQRDAGRQALRSLEAPYIGAAAEQVPAVLDVPIPKRLS